MKFVFLVLLFQVAVFTVSGQSKKFYCPPCNCTKDGMLFTQPGTCPDRACRMDLLPVEGNYMESKLKFMAVFLRSPWIMRFYDVLILPSILQGFILSLILIFRTHDNKRAAYFLALLIITLSLQNIKYYSILNVLVSYVSNTGGNPEYHIQSLAFPLSGVLFIGPALYFYVRSLTTPEFRFRKQHLLHFTPGFIMVLVNSLVFFDIGGTPVHASLMRFFSTASSIEHLFAISLFFYYLFLSVRLMRGHERWIYQHFSTTSRKSLNWLKNLVISLSLVWMVWLFAVIINLFTGDFILTYFSSYPFQIATCIIIFWIGYVGFIQGELFSMELSWERKIDQLKVLPKRNTEGSNEVKEVLLKAMEVEKLYLTPDLTLAMLAHQLNVSPKNISQTLNHELKKNFHDFVNAYRIEEVKRRLLSTEYDHLTLVAVALDSGFNSKSSFNRVFMKATGVSPKEYKYQQAVGKKQ
jgi:AraC-like DNA-binding protein